MKTILFATDFSNNSRKAWEYAVEMAKRSDAELVGVHIYIPPAGINDLKDAAAIRDIRKSTADRKKEALRTFCTDRLKGEELEMRIKYVVKEEEVITNGIIDLIDELDADLAVLGTKGKSMLREMIMGSTSFGVIKDAVCPVLTVPLDAESADFNKIVYATDFEASDIECITGISEIAGYFNAEIIVLHISTGDEYKGDARADKFRDQLLENITYPNLKFESFISDDVFEQLNAYLQDHTIRLVSMFEREKNSVFKKWFHRDLVKRMAFHSNVPLLSFNEKSLDKVSSSMETKRVKTINSSK